MENINLTNPSVLAFVGDAVYTLLVRESLSNINRPSGKLHSSSVKLVNAAAQAEAFLVIEPILNETELTVFKRGRNFHTTTTPKNVTNAQYHTATGLECLFGYLYLDGKQERIEELFGKIKENLDKK